MKRENKSNLDGENSIAALECQGEEGVKSESFSEYTLDGERREVIFSHPVPPDQVRGG